MAEKTLWSYVRKGMKGKWDHATRHEDLIGVGIADVSYYHYGNSWIELKSVKELPKRATTGINLGQWHMNGGAQRHFLIKRHGWLLVRILRPDRTYLLFDYKNLPPWERPYWTWTQMGQKCCYLWEYRIDFPILENLLGAHL